MEIMWHQKYKPIPLKYGNPLNPQLMSLTKNQDGKLTFNPSHHKSGSHEEFSCIQSTTKVHGIVSNTRIVSVELCNDFKIECGIYILEYGTENSKCTL
jgi:hypothetical protein